MKILLTRPAQIFKIGILLQGSGSIIPIGLLSVGSYLESKNHQVKIFDFLVEKTDNILFYYNDILKDNINKDVLCGASQESFINEIKAFCPDIIGISNLFTENLNESIKLAQIIKSLNPKIITVLGGACATINKKVLLTDNKSIDFIVKGDGEMPLSELCHSLENKTDISNIKGISYFDYKGIWVDNEISYTIQRLDDYGISILT